MSAPAATTWRELLANQLGRGFLASAATLVLLTTVSAASAEPNASQSEELGRQGQFVLADLLGLSLTTVGPTSQNGLLFVPYGWLSTWRSSVKETYNGVEYTTDHSTVTAAPSVDFFVLDRVSLGGTLAVGYAKREMSTDPEIDFDVDAEEYYFSMTPRVGVTWPLSEDLTLWTLAAGGYAWGHTEYPDQDVASASWRGDAELQLVARAGRSVLFAVGPGFIVSSFKETGDSTGATVREGWLAGGTIKGTIGLVL
jgi:hypothetical protein